VEKVRVPLLLLSAEDDPFIPAETIPRFVQNAQVTWEITKQGGHLGFIEGGFPSFYAERRAIEFLAGHLDRAA
jgi:predicted alpha/beta-fold hydrolase